MANEFKHGSVGSSLTQSEYEAIGGHVLDSQATGDIIYASSATQLSRLGKGTDGQVLTLASGIPSWATNSVTIKADDIATGDGAVNFATTSGNITIDAQATDADVIIKVDDGGSPVTAVTFDGSEAGKAIFVSDVSVGGSLQATSDVNVGGELQTANIGYTDGDNSMTIADGGKVTFSAGFAVGSDASGDILYSNGTNYVRLAKGSDDQVLTLASGVPSWATPASGGGSITRTASGALANGDMVSINTNGTVSKANVVVSSSTTVGTSVEFESGGTHEISCAYDSANNRVVVTYMDQGDNYYGKACVGTVSGTTISWGTPVTFDSNQFIYYTNITFDSNAEKMVLVWRRASGSTGIYSAVGTVSGTSISFGSTQQVTSDGATMASENLTFDSNLNKAVVAMQKSNGYGISFVGTVSGTSVTWGSEATFESATTNHISTCFDSNSNKVVIAYRDDGNSDYGTAIVGTVSGTDITFGTAVVYESAQVTYTTCAFDSANNKVVIGYTDNGNSQYGTAIVGTVSGTAISFGTAVVFESAEVAYKSSAFDVASGTIAIAYEDVGNSQYGTIIFGTVSGTSISFSSATVFESDRIDESGICYDSTAENLVITYADYGDGEDGYGIVVDRVVTTNTPDWIGVAQGAIGDGASGTIDIVGSVNSGQSGLTVGSRYYIKNDATITTTVTAGREVGRAVSATELLITQGSVT
jgi:hypothetical protein